MGKVQINAKVLFGIDRGSGIDDLLRGRHTSLEQVRDEERIKAALRRAVNREKAPDRLINSIRDAIRG